MPAKKRIPALSVLTKSAVSDLLVHMLCNEADFKEPDIADVCTILSNLGLLKALVECVLDKLSDIGAPNRIWDRALKTVVNAKTTNLKIKPGWPIGDHLENSLINLSRLVYLDVTGNCVG